MKRSLLPLLALSATLVCLPVSLPAQGLSTSTAAAEKPKQLSSTDKRAVKEAGEAILAVRRLAQITEGQGPGVTETKDANAKIVKTMDEAWSGLGVIAQNHKGELPKTEDKPADKTLKDRLLRLDADKFEKGFYKAFSKETKDAVADLTDAEKSAQLPELKTFVQGVLGNVKTIHDEALKAEAAANEKKK